MTTYTEQELIAAVQAGYYIIDGLPLATRSWLEGYRAGAAAAKQAATAQWRAVMRRMIERAECNDPGNPHLPQAQAMLSAGKENKE
jgi:hypothetical protein